MTTPRDRADVMRRQRLEAIEQQVKDGSLTIRSMTPEEREKYPKPDRPRRQRRRS
jgi:signal recognition particle GTPase